MAQHIALAIADEERLDQQDPLRHLREHATIIPPQPTSVQNALLDLAVPLPTPHPPIRLTLAVDAAPGCGGITWPAGEVLARYLARRGPRALKGKRILELGSGTGLVGILAGALGADVWITDQAPLVPTMHRNSELNAPLAPSVRVAELNWGEPIPPDLPPTFDLVLAADCVYFEPAFPLLVQTLRDLLPPAQRETEALFCYKKRRKADKRFFALLKKHFTWEDVKDDPERETYAREAISLLRLRRR
ncbi:putative methyltransferase-domain-containing protein [Vararia minispora EC-137]|uniref:Methyltransferase-domain-containing protein n=1 Tax=Vararia minispora EC-137 TaxID=1314806 RepID=A0ACB8Q9N3_9AGAM|nr:putative methyltransferase-domain-containing protein [Vararia minispora EC-137]